MSTSSATLKRIRDNYSVTYKGYSVKRDLTQEREDYIAVREYFLKREVALGRIDAAHLNVIEDFSFPSDTLVATYTNPKTGFQEHISMRDVKEANDVLQPFLEKSAKVQREMGISLLPHCKGNNSDRAKESLQKNNDKALSALTLTEQEAFDKLLPQTLAHLPPHLQAEPGIKAIITRRVLFIEFYQKRLIDTLKGKIADREQALQGPINDQMVANKIHQEIQHLKGLLDKVEKLDKYALYHALVAHPVGPEDRNAAANKLYEQVKADIAGHTGFTFSKLNPFSKGSKPTEVQNEYALDVAALLFTDARSNLDFSRQTQRPLKRERLEDVFMREAIKFAMHVDATPGNEFQAEGFQNTIFLNEMKEGLLDEVKTELSALGAIATHAIGFHQGNEYQTPAPEDYAQNATAEQKQAVDKRNEDAAVQNAATLKGHIAAHRTRVRKDLTLDQVPKPQNQNTGLLANPVAQIGPVQVGPLALVTAGATVASQLLPEVAVHTLTNWMPEFVVNGVRAVANHPITAIFGATIADQAISYAAPKVRGPDRIVRREFKKRRALGVAAVGAGALMLVRSAPQATLDSVLAVTDSLKQYCFIPANTAVKLVGGIVVAEKVARRVGTDIKERNYTRLAVMATAGTLAVLMYQAVNDGVVDNSLLEVSGNAIGSMLNYVAETAYNVYSYNRLTQWASTIGVSGLLALTEGKPLQMAAIEGAVSIPMGGMPINRLAVAGSKVADDVLPEKVAKVVRVPANIATRFTANIGMAKNGEMIGGVVVGVCNIAGRAFGLFASFGRGVASAYETMRQSNSTALSIM
ncbi:MAG: hypothetical protein JSS30_06350 [Verrucomicrobia bacterium]|nr:hypothetical protein [Verrucomicrobiota bacterium]